MAKIKNTIEYLEYCIIAIWQYKTAGTRSAYYFIGMRLNFANRSGVFYLTTGL